jgi:hypothetical protein
VRNAFAFIDHVHNRRAVDGADVVWLATGGWVERGAIEIESGAAVGPVDYAGVKIPQVRIVISTTAQSWVLPVTYNTEPC